MKFRADLHCHTTCSDGSMTPREIVFHAKEMGLSGLSITDHDNVSAYTEAIPAAKEAKIALGTGVEFSSVTEGRSVHLLGYDFDPTDPELKAFCERHVIRRRGRNKAIFSKLEKQGMKIDEEKFETLLEKGLPVGRPHIALELVEKGYVKTVQEAFDRFLGDRKPCFDPGSPISTRETIDLIHKLGGKAFLAHPHFLRNSRLIRQLLSLPLDGIECYYARIPSEQEAKWVQLAEKHGLLMSGGSDFHGEIKPMIPLGCSWVTEETFDKIFERHRWKY